MISKIHIRRLKITIDKGLEAERNILSVFERGFVINLENGSE